MTRLCATSTPPAAPLPAPRHTTRAPNALAFDVRPVLYRLVGVDLTQIHGLGPYNALKLVQGCQYTSLAFGARCRESGVALSMGSVVLRYHFMLEPLVQRLNCLALRHDRVS